MVSEVFLFISDPSQKRSKERTGDGLVASTLVGDWMHPRAACTAAALDAVSGEQWLDTERLAACAAKLCAEAAPGDEAERVGAAARPAMGGAARWVDAPHYISYQILPG